MIRTIISIHLAIVATVSSISSALAMETEQGYLCNLCHSLKNEYPFPPPSAEQAIVQFPKVSQIEAFGMPWDRGLTCIDVWNNVLDFQNPKIVDESSCRSMAEVYAPQCCSDRIIPEAVSIAAAVENKTDSSVETGATAAKNTGNETGEPSLRRVEQETVPVALSSGSGSVPRNLRGHL